MMKRFISFLVLIAMLISSLSIFSQREVYAYVNNSYFNSLRVGLISMTSTNISITLLGSYTVNSISYPSGTKISLSVNGLSLSINGNLENQISIIPTSNNSYITMTSGLTTNKYKGAFIIKVDNNKILPINIIDMENYLKGVVGYEMSDYFPVEALKVQAVAARNYALTRMNYEAIKGYDFDDTIKYQVYNGFNESFSRVIEAVDATRGEVLLYDEKLVETLYSASHGGITEASENVWGSFIPYLRSNIDAFENESWPNGTKLLTNSQIQGLLSSKGYLSSTDTFISLDLSSIKNFASGRVASINIIYKDALGINKLKTVTKDNTRTFLSLPSNLYTVYYDTLNSRYVFTGKGNGHGLGMSQIGAKNRASAGQTYDQILKFYYQNTYLKNIIQKASIENLTQDKTSLLVNDIISFKGTAIAGNSSEYLYKYVIKNGGLIIFENEFTNTSMLDFKALSAGNYTVELFVKDKYSISDFDDERSSEFIVYDEPIISESIINKQEILLGSDINLTTEVLGGSLNYQYKYEVKKDGLPILTTDYTEGKVFNYTPLQEGNYKITVYVKDKISVKEYDVLKEFNLTVYNAPTISLEASKTSLILGDTSNIKTTVTNGSGINQYKFVVTDISGTISDTDYTTSNTFSFTPIKEGSYQVLCYVKDSCSNNVYDDVKFMDMQVYSPKITGVTASSYFYEGQDVNFLINSANSSPEGNNFRYEVLLNNNLILNTEYSLIFNYKFTPMVSGSYTFRVYSKDSLSTNTFDSYKEFSMLIKAKPIYLSILPLSYGMKNNDVITLQNALTSLGYYITDKAGDFGTKTKSAVIAFQKSKSLSADGVVGNITYKALNSALIEKSGIKNITY